MRQGGSPQRKCPYVADGSIFHGDERKKELDKIGEGALRRYAVRNALRLLWALLSVGGLPKRSPRKSRKGGGNKPGHSAALSQVQRLSSVAARDAGFIIDDPGGHPSGEVRLEQDLYVNRSIEGVIHGLFDTSPEDDLPFIVVAGEAGFGKTSLLWQLHRTMVEGDRLEPWFVKCPAAAPLPSSLEKQPQNPP